MNVYVGGGGEKEGEIHGNTFVLEYILIINCIYYVNSLQV